VESLTELSPEMCNQDKRDEKRAKGQKKEEEEEPVLLFFGPASLSCLVSCFLFFCEESENQFSDSLHL